LGEALLRCEACCPFYFLNANKKIPIVFPTGETGFFGFPLNAGAGVTTVPIISHLLTALQAPRLNAMFYP